MTNCGRGGSRTPTWMLTVSLTSVYVKDEKILGKLSYKVECVLTACSNGFVNIITRTNTQ